MSACRIATVAVLATAAVVLSADQAQAQTASASLDSASVSRNCTIATEPLAFGAYDPVVANAVTPLEGTGAIIITCTQGTPATIRLSAGDNADGTTRQMTDGATGTLVYEAFKDPTRNELWGDTGADELGAGSAPSVAPRTFTTRLDRGRRESRPRGRLDRGGRRERRAPAAWRSPDL